MRYQSTCLVALALWLTACTNLRPVPSTSAADSELTRQILVTTRQSTTLALGLVGDPSTIYLRRPGSGYAFFSGNSMSSAFVAGVVALLVEHQPRMTAQAVYELLADTSTEGSINACRALSKLSIAPGCELEVNAITARDSED